MEQMKVNPVYYQDLTSVFDLLHRQVETYSPMPISCVPVHELIRYLLDIAVFGQIFADFATDIYVPTMNTLGIQQEIHENMRHDLMTLIKQELHATIGNIDSDNAYHLEWIDARSISVAVIPPGREFTGNVASGIDPVTLQPIN